jgi:hypothetical protein
MQWGIDIVKRQCMSLSQRVDDSGTGTGTSRHLYDLRAAIAKYMEGGMNYQAAYRDDVRREGCFQVAIVANYVMRKSSFRTERGNVRKLVDDLLKFMELDGEISAVDGGDRGWRGKIYRVTNIP